MISEKKEHTKIEGWVNINIARVDSDKAVRMEGMIAQMMAVGDKEVGRLIAEFNRLFLVRQYRFHNIVPTIGRTRIAEALTGNITDENDIIVNYGALGVGTTTPVNGDTTLDTESFRKLIASTSFAANVAYLTAFYLAADVSGTFYEHGIFIDGNASADTGVLLSRVLLNAPTGIAKSLAETLTIEHQLTIT